MSIPKPLTILKFAAAAHLFATYVGYPNGTIGPSMLPTLWYSGDFVWISTLHRRGRGVRVGDVVSARHPTEPDEGTVKRVLAMPGDWVLKESFPADIATGDQEVEAGSSGGGSGGSGGGKKPVGGLDKGDRVRDEGAVAGGKGVVRWSGREVEAERTGLRRNMIQVPEGHCWLAGDNVSWSRDSRDYGPIPLASIKGKVLARCWPPSRIGLIRNNMERVNTGES